MTKSEFLAKYDNKKPYGWVCYAVQLCPPTAKMLFSLYSI